jgi:hypothetical protein
MRPVLVIFFLASSALAQSAPTGTAACGAADARFEVKTAKGRYAAAQSDVGKALVYFVEDDSDFGSTPKPTTRAGVDGGWVGATHGNSYFYLSVDPGEHHLCASWQSEVILGQGHKVAVAHFTAAAGEVYYFEVKNTWTLDLGSAGISLKPLDSDEGELLVRKFSLSTFHLKK